MSLNRRKKYKSSLAKEYTKSVSSHDLKHRTNVKTLDEYQDYFRNFKNAISERDNDNGNLSVFKRNWKSLCRKASNEKELILGLHKAVKEFINSPSPLKTQCFTHLIDTLDKWENARDKVKSYNKSFTEAYCYSLMGRPLREKTKEDFFTLYEKNVQTSNEKDTSLFTWICAIQHLITGDDEYKDNAIEAIKNITHLKENPHKQQILQACHSFDIDPPFDANTIQQKDAPSRIEKQLKAKIKSIFPVKPDANLTPSFPHRVDIEIDTKDENTRLLIEIDGLYHNAGRDENEQLRMSGPTLLRSNNIVNAAQRDTENVVLLRITEPTIDHLKSMNNEKFTKAFLEIIEHPIISNQMAVHISEDNEFFLTSIPDQYEPHRQNFVNQQIAKLLSSAPEPCPQ